MSQRTLWINLDQLEAIMGGIKENFGDDFKHVKVYVEAVKIENAKLTVTGEEGIIIQINNKFVLENPTVT